MQIENRSYKFKVENGPIIDVTSNVITKASNYLQFSSIASEAGGYLVGFENSKTSNITINDISLPSDNDIRTRIFCKIKDLAHKFFLQEQKRKENYYMGNWHTHPQKSPTPSSIDINEWKNVITKDRTGSDYAFFIIFGTEEFKAWYGNYNTKQICELKEYIVKK